MTKAYRLGFGALELGGHAYKGLQLREVALDVIQDAADRNGGTVSLQVLNQSRDRLVSIERVQYSSGLHLVMVIGNAAPWHAGASSRALLAFLLAEDLDVVLSSVVYS